LLKKAIEHQDNFKSDMQDILGEDVLACPKVAQVTKDGRTSFSAMAVRRVFVKWC
jgi:ribosomal protein S5